MKRNGRVLDLLKLLALIELKTPKSVPQLVEQTGNSRSALMRLLKMARDELHVGYEFVRSRGYVITSWGVLDRDCVLDRYAKTVGNKSDVDSRG